MICLTIFKSTEFSRFSRLVTIMILPYNKEKEEYLRNNGFGYLQFCCKYNLRDLKLTPSTF